MVLSGKLTADELLRVRQIEWTPNFWLHLFNHVWTRNSLKVFTGIAVLSFAVAMVPPRIHRLGIFVACTSFGAVYAYAMKRALRISPALLESLNRNTSKLIRLQEKVLEVQAEDGTVVSLPWRSLSGWRDGDSVFLIDTPKDGYIILPCSQLSVEDDLRLRQLLTVLLGPSSPALRRRKVQILRNRR